jgi:hypothetical protein
MRQFICTPHHNFTICVALAVCLTSFPAQALAQQDDVRLVAIGALAGSNVYTTYGYIGTVADLLAYEKYDSARVQALMKEVAALSEASIKQLQRVRATDIIDNDKKALDDMVAIYRLLQQEANALSDYSVSKSKDHLDAYNTARTTVWPKIKTILGIKDQPQ